MGGGIVYGLKQSDFVVEDNGVPQKIHVQEELDTAPVALVVAMEEGRAGCAGVPEAGASWVRCSMCFSRTRAARPRWSGSDRSRIDPGLYAL